MENFEVKYMDKGCYKELKYLKINSTIYTPDRLSFEAKELLTSMAYYDYEKSLEYFDNLAQLLGYDTVLQGILDLNEMGAYVSTSEIYRGLVMNSYKNKYKGMMRDERISK